MLVRDEVFIVLMVDDVLLFFEDIFAHIGVQLGDE